VRARGGDMADMVINRFVGCHGYVTEKIMHKERAEERRGRRGRSKRDYFEFLLTTVI
jgi:hypothetical protein